jgi:transcriptional regulator with XRE-family HTH domain
MGDTRKQPNPFDIHVGQRIRMRRNMLGLSQTKLAEFAHVTFQMVQKYEKGSCRVGASRLMVIARALDTPVAYFFDGYKGEQSPAIKTSEDTVVLDDTLLTQRESIDLLKSYYALPEATRKHILSMIKGLQHTEDSSPNAEK